MFTILSLFSGHLFLVVFVLMTRKTVDLYTAVFTKVKQLVPLCSPTEVMADFEEASIIGFRNVFERERVRISGCWFHYCQAVAKRCRKVGLTRFWPGSQGVTKIIKCIMSLPLLPPEDIMQGLNDITTIVDQVDDAPKELLVQLIAYIRRQWVSKASIGPTRLSVNGQDHRTNNGVESYHAGLRRRIAVAHPNLYTFLDHLKNVSTDTAAEYYRLQSGQPIRRSRKSVMLQRIKE